MQKSVSDELLELSQRADSADQRISKLEVREELAPTQGIDPMQLANQARAGNGILTIGLLKTRVTKLEQRLARLEAGRNE